MRSTSTPVGTVHVGDSAFRRDGNNMHGGKVLDMQKHPVVGVNEIMLYTDCMSPWLLASEVQIIVPVKGVAQVEYPQ